MTEAERGSPAVGLVVVDGEGRVLAVDREAEALFQSSPDRLVGRSLSELLEGDDGRPPLERLREDGACRLSLVRASGKRLAVAARVRENVAGPVLLLEMVVAPAARDPGACEFPESGRVLSTLMSNLPGMVYRCQNDPDWTMVFCSEGCLSLTGYRPEDLYRNRSLTYASLIHPDDREDVWHQVQEALERRGPFRFTYRIRTASGQEKWLWEQGRGIFSPEGELLFLEGFITDVSDRMQAEEALRQSEEQLRRARQMEALGRLAGGVAHDFNNLLTAITGHAEAMLSTLPVDSALRSRVNSILRAADRGAALTLRLLARGRPGVGGLPEVLDAHRVVRELHFLLEALVGPGVKVVADLPPGEALVRIDRLQLEQVLMNLALNSRDALPEGGVFRITSRPVRLSAGDLPAGPYLSLEVADDGQGIAPEILPHVFEPFFTTKEMGRGTGLGLFSAYGIVQGCGGTISVESRPGRGTVFTVLLPLEEEPAPDAPEPALPPAGGSETILLVEDEDLLRELARDSLKRQGYRVLEAADGVEALELASRHPERIDLLVTDVLMPRLGGLELADRLEQLRPDLRVLLISGYVHEAHPARDRGRDLIEKPFRADRLLRRVREILDGEGVRS